MAFEIGGGHFAALLRPFHGQSFGVLGLARASGPFQYPNIAAMYLEASVPVVMAVGVLALDWVDVHEGQKILVATTLVAGIMLYALVMAASRAGLITELCVLVGMGALARDQRMLRRLAFGLAGRPAGADRRGAGAEPPAGAAPAVLGAALLVRQRRRADRGRAAYA